MSTPQLDKLSKLQSDRSHGTGTTVYGYFSHARVCVCVYRVYYVT